MEKKNTYLMLAILLWLILILNIISLFKKDAAWKLETMKVGGPENMKLVEQLYSSESYISQQTMAIEQALAQINMMNNMNQDDLSGLMNLENWEMILDEDVEIEETVE